MSVGPAERRGGENESGIVALLMEIGEKERRGESNFDGKGKDPLRSLFDVIPTSTENTGQEYFLIDSRDF